MMTNSRSIQTLLLAVAIPLTAGILAVHSLRAQAQSSERFEVASVRRVDFLAARNGGVPVFPVTGGVGRRVRCASAIAAHGS